MPSLAEFLIAVLINMRNIGLYVHLVWMTFILVHISGLYLIFFVLVSTFVTIAVIVVLNDKDKESKTKKTKKKRKSKAVRSSNYQSFIISKT